MGLCLYTLADEGEPRLGYIAGDSGDTVIDSAAAGGPRRLAEALEMSAAELEARLQAIHDIPGVPLSDVHLQAPIDWQEVWAAGVTYLKSRDARMEESTEKSVYDRVYDADRPEIFLKGNVHRIVGPGQAVGIRSDSDWDVPEPECTLVINSGGEIVGYTVGNDVSSRSIEGDNPLYLPQAKVFDKCGAIGPVIALAWEVVSPTSLPIHMSIERDGKQVFHGETGTDQMHRSFEDLRDWLFRHNSFGHGVFLMTGTGLVPPSEFTLQDGDEVSITIVGIGTLTSPVVRLTT